MKNDDHYFISRSLFISSAYSQLDANLLIEISLYVDCFLTKDSSFEVAFR